MLFDLRCTTCRKLLGKMTFVGFIEIKCRQCGHLNKLGFKELKVAGKTEDFKVVQYSERS